MPSKGSIWTDEDGLHIRQGRYGELTIPMKNPDGSVYTMDPTDILTITVRKGRRITADEPPVILTRSKTGTNVFVLDADATKDIKVGEYQYDVTLFQLGTKPIPVIDPESLWIEGVIT